MTEREPSSISFPWKSDSSLFWVYWRCLGIHPLWMNPSGHFWGQENAGPGAMTPNGSSSSHFKLGMIFPRENSRICPQILIQAVVTDETGLGMSLLIQGINHEFHPFLCRHPHIS